MIKEKFDFYDKTVLKSYDLDSTARYQLKMLDSLDNFTRKHSEGVANITCRICDYLHLNKDFTTYCTTCAYLHDIGKIGIDDAILNKEGKLDEQEWKMMKTHPQIDANILDKSHLLVPFSKIVLHHHERYGLNGKEIPLGLRIIALCDSIDKMT